MSTFDPKLTLPPEAQPSVETVRRLADAGYRALLAGGCVRDLLLRRPPKDFDVATSALPDEVCRLFKPARRVGAHFGVVLVRKGGAWIEVATFRADGPYLDGRRPQSVTFCGEIEDAQRRDFTVNGLFYDPRAEQVLDYVEGRLDLEKRLLRAIGRPQERFREDHLRLLRAVRFAAALEFEIEPDTWQAMREAAPRVAGVAVERVLEELNRTLTHPTRSRAVRLLESSGLLPHLWPQSGWTPERAAAATDRLQALVPDGSLAAAWALLLADQTVDEVCRVARALSASNDLRETVAWLVEHQYDLLNPDGLSLAELKRLAAHDAFDALRDVVEVRWRSLDDGPQRRAALARRLEVLTPEMLQPAPLVTGDDLVARGIPTGPRYKQVLDLLYARQLNEQVVTREQALRELEELLGPPEDRQ